MYLVLLHHLRSQLVQLGSLKFKSIVIIIFYFCCEIT